jgi:hypothetical protein
MYPEEVAPGKRAVIKATQWGSRRKTMEILKVDGKETSNFLGYMYHGINAGEVYVTPGKHNILVEVRNNSTYVTADLCLVAEAGECYIIKYLTKGYGALMWFENERTGQPVTNCGSDDEPGQN